MLTRTNWLVAIAILCGAAGCDRSSQNAECENHDECQDEYVCVVGTCVPEDEALAHFRSVSDEEEQAEYDEALIRAEAGTFYRQVVAARAAGDDVTDSFAETTACYFGEPEVPRHRLGEREANAESIDVVEYGSVDANSAVILARGRTSSADGVELFQRAVFISRPNNTSAWLIHAETSVDDVACFPFELELGE